MNKISLNPMIRVAARALSNEISEVKKRYDAIINKEIKPAKDERDALFREEQGFIEEASAFLKMVPLGDKLNVETQVGPDGGTIIHHYAGAVLLKKYGMPHKVFAFDITHPDAYEGRPFTVGLSCLLSIEKAK